MNIETIQTIIDILQGFAIITGIWATYFSYKKYREDKHRDQIVRNQETKKFFKKEFYLKQMQYYSEIIEILSILSTVDKTSPDWQKAKSEFWKMYWGKLCLVEDKKVETQMKIIGENILSNYESGKISQSKLQQHSLKLAHLCRKHILDTWLDEDERKLYNQFTES